MRTRRAPLALLSACVVILASACLNAAPAPSVLPSASPTPSPTAANARPKFELASYQYAIQTKGKLRVGTFEDNPPFAVKNAQTGRYEGFDADVAREIAKAIFGAEANADPDRFIEWVPVVSATRISSLTDSKVDIVAATLTMNDERQKQIDFSAVYFRTGQRILVKKDDTTITSIADLAGKTVCTASGSSSAQNVAKLAKDAKLLLLETYPPCLSALQQGQTDAVSTDETILFRLVKQDPNTKIVGGYLSDEPFGIGVRKGRVGFVPFLNTVIVAMIADGRWAALYKKWITPASGDLKDGPHDKGRPSS